MWSGIAVISQEKDWQHVIETPADCSVIVKEALGKIGTNRKGVVNRTENLVSL